MERYLGMDVHAESCSFCLLNASGKVVRRDVVETNGQALVAYLKQLAGRLHLCFEESEWAGWLWEILSPHVAEVVVFRGERRKGSKSDAIDAHALAGPTQIRSIPGRSSAGSPLASRSVGVSSWSPIPTRGTR